MKIVLLGLFVFACLALLVLYHTQQRPDIPPHLPPVSEEEETDILDKMCSSRGQKASTSWALPVPTATSKAEKSPVSSFAPVTLAIPSSTASSEVSTLSEDEENLAFELELLKEIFTKRGKRAAKESVNVSEKDEAISTQLDF